MEDRPIKKLELLLERFRAGGLADRMNNAKRDELNRWIDYVESWIEDDRLHPRPWDYESTSSRYMRLERLENKVDLLLRREMRCNAPSDFYFRPDVKAYDAGVAMDVFSMLQQSYAGPAGTYRTIVFHACSGLHDRVWLRHETSITDDSPYSGWEARVVGASVNGVRARPTYVVDMNEDDANDYSKYLKNIRDSLVPGSVTFAPPP